MRRSKLINACIVLCGGLLAIAPGLAGQGQRNAAGCGSIEGPRAMCQQDPERLPFRGRHPQSRVEIVLLRIIRTPIPRVVDTDERECRASMLDHMRAVFDEYLAGVAHAFDHGIGRSIDNDGVSLDGSLLAAQQRSEWTNGQQGYDEGSASLS